jgi:uncharacterized protein YbbC (DUF1343 family)
MHMRSVWGRLDSFVVAWLATAVIGCGQIGHQIASGAGTVITPDPWSPIRDGMRSAAQQRNAVRPGISVPLSDSIALIRGPRVGLLTKQTGVDEHGVSDIELLRGDVALGARVRLVTLFSPERGIRGTEDRENLASGVDARSGLVVHSLHTSGAIAPPASTLRGIDMLVVDLQDIGTRTWTYVGSVVYAMRAAARNHLPIIAPDRPNARGAGRELAKGMVFRRNGPAVGAAVAEPPLALQRNQTPGTCCV